MMLKSIAWLVVFWMMQIIAALLFKIGSSSAARWVPCFVTANIIGVASTWILMVLYRDIQVNIAMGLAVGVTFLLNQIALGIWFRSELSMIQYAGILGISGGMLFLCLGAHK